MKQKPITNPFQTTDFKELENTWYARLYDAGFNDIEDTSRQERPLRSWHNLRFRSTHAITRENRKEYFIDARALLNIHRFKNETHRRIWELHCQGFSKREIEILILSMPKKYKREQIGNIIRLIATEIKR